MVGYRGKKWYYTEYKIGMNFVLENSTPRFYTVYQKYEL